MDLSWIDTIPEPLKTILIGAAGDFAGGVASDIAGRLLDAAGYQVKKRFRPEPQQDALNEAMAEALLVTVSAQTDDPDLMAHYLTLFGEWSARDAVAGELSQVIDPRPDAEIDLDLLAAEFEASGYDPDLLGGDVVFQNVVAQFVSSFYDAAARQPTLQGQIEIGLLRGIAERAEEQVELLQRVADSLERQPGKPGPTTTVKINGDRNLVMTGRVGRDLIVVDGDLVQNTGGDETDPQALRQAYLNRVLEQTQTLQLTGVDPKAAQDATGAHRAGAGRGLHRADDAAVGAGAGPPRPDRPGARDAPPVRGGAAEPRAAAGPAGRPRQRQDDLRQLRGAVPGRRDAGA